MSCEQLKLFLRSDQQTFYLEAFTKFKLTYYLNLTKFMNIIEFWITYHSLLMARDCNLNISV